MNIKKNKLFSDLLTLLGAFLFAVSASASAYTYEVATEQPWVDTSMSVSTTQYVQVRAYVPGSKTLNYSTIPVYSSRTESGSNSLGDTVGYTYNIYGTSPAYVYPYDSSGYNIMYPTYQVMRTRLNAVNDQRLAVGEFVQVGAYTHPFVYDLVYKRYTQLDTVDSVLNSAVDINNYGQVIGTKDWDTYYSQQGYVYDCQNGLVDISVPGSTYTIVNKIDDEGNVYGSFSHPDLTEIYFIARPETVSSNITCPLVARDDKFEPITFGTTQDTFELDGDVAQTIVIADFDGQGKNDLLIDYGEYSVTLYKAENDFNEKQKYKGMNLNQVIATYYPEVEIPAFTDVNNDAIDDEIEQHSSYLRFSLGKGDGTFYYVPQYVLAQHLADINNDGYLDAISVDGAFVNIRYQQDPQNTINTDTTQTTTDTATIDTTTPTTETTATTGTGSQPYRDSLEAEFPGAEVIKLNIDEETGEAEFKINVNGKTYEGLMDSEFYIVEIYN